MRVGTLAHRDRRGVRDKAALEALVQQALELKSGGGESVGVEWKHWNGERRISKVECPIGRSRNLLATLGYFQRPERLIRLYVSRNFQTEPPLRRKDVASQGFFATFRVPLWRKRPG